MGDREGATTLDSLVSGVTAFIIGIVLMIFAAWCFVSAYHYNVAIEQFTEMQQTMFNARLALGSLFIAAALFINLKDIKIARRK
jgi:hypothetical protein